jgi:PAS domain
VNTTAYPLAVSTGPPQIMPADTFEHPNLLTLLAHWEHLRGSDAMPTRADIRKEISHLLKYVHLCDVIANGEDFRFRLIGDTVFHGLRNQTGRLVTEHPDMGVRFRFPILMREAVVTKRPVRGVAVRETTRGSFNAESIWLPFGDAEVNQILGMTVLAFIGTDGL